MKKDITMKYSKIIFLFSLLIGFVSCQQEHSIRFMSYNVRNGMGMDDVTNYERTARVITEWNPDVVALQELDSVTERSHQRYVLDELAKLTGMHATYSAAIDFSGGKYGIGMLSKEVPLQVWRYALPGREEQRTLLVAEFKDYVCCCMHLSLTEEDRMLSLPILQQAFASFQKPLFIAGDWNATPESAFIKRIDRDFLFLTDTTQLTVPADTPNCTLDYIALSKNGPASIVEMTSEVVPASEASDHRPVAVSLRWKGEK